MSHPLILKITDKQCGSPKPFPAWSFTSEDNRGRIITGMDRIKAEPGLMDSVGPMGEVLHEHGDGFPGMAATIQPMLEAFDMRECEVQPVSDGKPPFLLNVP
ncbi:MAG TPA: hypothetical protein VIB38_06685 [Aestuariivirgaceae bacterium]